jgi:hypothetical protein
MNFTGLTAEQILIKAVNRKGLQTANSGGTSIDEGWFLTPENMELNIINDHTLQLNLTQLSSDVTHLNIQLNNIYAYNAFRTTT